MEYRIAEDPAKIGAEPMKEHYHHPLGVCVESLFVKKTPKSKGRDVWGMAKKVSGLNAFLALGLNVLPETYEDQPNDLFVIEIFEEVWDRLRPGGRKALVDHELSHCEIETNEDCRVSLAIVGHAVTEFEAIARRNDLWREDVEEFVGAGAEQIELEEVGA